MKKINLLLILLAILMAAPSQINAQEKSTERSDQKVKLKILKEDNGDVTELEQEFESIDDEQLQKLLDQYNIKLKQMEKLDGDAKAYEYVFETEDTWVAEGAEGEQNIDVQVIQTDEDGEINKNVNVQVIKVRTDDGEEIDVDVDQIISETLENLNIDNADGKEVRMMKIVDEDGNVTVTKTVDGEEVIVEEIDQEKLDGNSFNYFIHEGEEGDHKMKVIVNEEMVIDIDSDYFAAKDDKENSFIFIKTISKTEDGEVEKKSKRAKKEEKKKNIVDIKDLSFQPNPNNGQFSVSFNSPKATDTKVSVTDVKGSIIHEELLPSFKGQFNKEYDVAEHGSGLYFLTIRQGANSVTKKIIVQ